MPGIMSEGSDAGSDPRVENPYVGFGDLRFAGSTRYPRLRSCRIILAVRLCLDSLVTSGPRSS